MSLSHHTTVHPWSRLPPPHPPAVAPATTHALATAKQPPSAVARLKRPPRSKLSAEQPRFCTQPHAKRTRECKTEAAAESSVAVLVCCSLQALVGCLLELALRLNLHSRARARVVTYTVHGTPYALHENTHLNTHLDIPTAHTRHNGTHMYVLDRERHIDSRHPGSRAGLRARFLALSGFCILARQRGEPRAASADPD